MKFKVLTEKESSDLIATYYTLRDLIDEIHTEAVAILERKYKEYVLNFNPTVFWFFTRTQLTFDEFISGIDGIGHVGIEEYNGKKYLQDSCFYTPKSINNVLKLSDLEYKLVETACINGLNIYKNHNKYINRLVRYAAKPLELESVDFDNFDKYKLWSKEIKEALDNYKQVP